MWVNYFILAGMIATAGAALYKVVFKPLLFTANKVNGWVDEREDDHMELGKLKAEVSDIRAMVMPNSGKSLYDKVGKLEAVGNEIKESQARLEKTLGDIAKK